MEIVLNNMDKTHVHNYAAHIYNVRPEKKCYTKWFQAEGRQLTIYISHPHCKKCYSGSHLSIYLAGDHDWQSYSELIILTAVKISFTYVEIIFTTGSHWPLLLRIKYFHLGLNYFTWG